MLDFLSKFHSSSTGQINDLQPKCKMEMRFFLPFGDGAIMRVLVCGGRAFNDWAVVNGVLDGIHHATPIECIIHGAATGADDLAERWARSEGIGRHRFPVLPAQWDKHGKAAGPMRNQAMLDKGKPDLVVAFPGGNGTADMVRRAKGAGVKVVEVSPPVQEW